MQNNPLSQQANSQFSGLVVEQRRSVKSVSLSVS